MSAASMKDPHLSGLVYGTPHHQRSKGRADLTPAQRRRLVKNARRWAKGLARAVSA